MTSAVVERLTQMMVGDFSWEFANLDMPGGCARFGWCDGDCKPLPPGRVGDHHSRYIASALRDRDLVEIAVGQWKADPAQPWYVSGSGGCYDNKDSAPRVGIFTCPADVMESKRVFLSVEDADGLAQALRLCGAEVPARALAAAVTFAESLTTGGREEKR